MSWDLRRSATIDALKKANTSFTSGVFAGSSSFLPEVAALFLRSWASTALEAVSMRRSTSVAKDFQQEPFLYSVSRALARSWIETKPESKFSAIQDFKSSQLAGEVAAALSLL